MVSPDWRQNLGRFRLRLAIVLTLRNFLRLSFAWLMIWAVFIALLRVVWMIAPACLLWGLAGVGAAAVVAGYLACRSLPSADQLRAALDRYWGMGGLLMSTGDVTLGDWAIPEIDAPLPSIHWQARRQVLQLIVAAGFVAAALLAPNRYFPTLDGQSLHVSSDVQKLQEKISTLKQEQVLPIEKAQLIEKDLERIANSAEGTDPAKTMEALDHINQSLSKVAEEKAELAIKETELGRQLQEMTVSLQNAKDRVSEEQLSKATQQLGQMVDDLAAENKELAKELSEGLREACREGTLSDEQLEELAEALKRCRACDRARLGELAKARLIDPSQIGRLEKAGEEDPEGLLAMLDDKGDDLAAVRAVCECERPGRGGVTRGRADAPMTWNNGANKENAAFKEQMLAPGAASLKDSRLVGMSAGAPAKANPDGGAASGALNTAQSGNGETGAQLILPEHEKAVQRYFNREKK